MDKEPVRKTETTIEFGEVLTWRYNAHGRPSTGVYPIQNWQKNGVHHRLIGPALLAYKFKNGEEPIVTAEEYYIEGVQITKQDFEEAVKEYKIKHGIPLDVGPEWKPGDSKSLPIKLPMHKNYSKVEEPTNQQLHCQLMQLDGKVTAMLERLNALELKKDEAATESKGYFRDKEDFLFRKMTDAALKSKKTTLDSTLTDRAEVGTCIYIMADKVSGGFVTSMPEFPGCMSQGDTVIEALVNIVQAYKDWVLTKEEAEEEEHNKLRPVELDECWHMALNENGQMQITRYETNEKHGKYIVQHGSAVDAWWNGDNGYSVKGTIGETMFLTEEEALEAFLRFDGVYDSLCKYVR